MLGGKNVNERFPNQYFVTNNPGTSAVDQVQNIARLTDQNTGNDNSIVTFNLQSGFDVSSLSEIAGNSDYILYSIRQEGDTVSIGALQAYLDVAESANLTSIIFDIPYQSGSFSSSGLSAAEAQINAFLAASPDNHALILISVNGGLGDTFTSDANAPFFGLLQQFSNSAYLGVNYNIGSVAPVVTISLGLAAANPYFTYELALANFTNDIFATYPTSAPATGRQILFS